MSPGGHLAFLERIPPVAVTSVGRGMGRTSSLRLRPVVQRSAGGEQGTGSGRSLAASSPSPVVAARAASARRRAESIASDYRVGLSAGPEEGHERVYPA